MADGDDDHSGGYDVDRGRCGCKSGSCDSSGAVLVAVKTNILGTRIEHEPFFGHRRDIPAKSRDILPPKFDFPGFEGHTEPFWPPPLHVEDPYPTRKYLDSKVWMCALLPCLNNGYRLESKEP